MDVTDLHSCKLGSQHMQKVFGSALFGSYKTGCSFHQTSDSNIQGCSVLILPLSIGERDL